jgi:hypothetical protein
MVDTVALFGVPFNKYITLLNNIPAVLKAQLGCVTDTFLKYMYLSGW